MRSLICRLAVSGRLSVPRRMLYVVGMVALSTCLLHAQEEAAPVTLRVYANLIQVPVLVLSDSLKPLPPIEPDRFTLSLNSGPPFRPTHVRLEGDDPINLSLLVDLHSASRSLLSHLPEALSTLVPSSLRPQDHVTVYALNCMLTRYANSSVPNALVLQASAEKTIHTPILKHCPSPTHLWDTMAFIARTSTTLPGRPVLLALTDGEDDGSLLRWSQVSSVAASKSMAIFVLTAPDPYAARSDTREDPLMALCERTGGMVLHGRQGTLADTLVRFMALLRDRYIISFPRPDTLQLGPPVDLQISLVKKHAFIRSTGIEVPVADTRLLTDPNTLRNNPAHAPEIGKRRMVGAPP